MTIPYGEALHLLRNPSGIPAMWRITRMSDNAKDIRTPFFWVSYAPRPFLCEGVAVADVMINNGKLTEYGQEFLNGLIKAEKDKQNGKD